jgi:hypothetical protein
MLRDPEFGPIRIRAFGTYAMKAIDPRALLREVVGTDSEVSAEEITELVRSIINTTFADLLGESQVAALDLASKYREYSEELRKAVCERVDDEYGLDITQMFIVNISLPEAVEKALDTRTSMSVVGDMNKFQQYQMGNAMMAAAENPNSGGAADGMGLGMGFAMAGRMMQPGGAAAPVPAATGGGMMAPPPPPGTAWHITVNGQTMGPFTMQQMAAGAASGEVVRDSLVWSAGMAGWVAASTVPQLNSLFGATPPPPPPPPPGATPPPPPVG